MRCGYPYNEPYDKDVITIRTAQPEDAQVIALLSEQLGYPTSTEDMLRRLDFVQKDEDHAVYVVEFADNNIIGWIHVHTCGLIISDFIAEIKGIVVEEKHRDHGVGRMLMVHAEQWAKKKGCKTMWISSNIMREGVQYFYERIGYNNIKTSRVFHKDL